MHIGVSNGFVVAHVITDDKTHDGSIASQLIQQVGEIDSITADKGYDQTQVQQSAYDHLREGGKSTFIQGKMRLYLNLKKLH